MKIEKARDIIGGYAKWWSDSVELHEAGEAVRLVCPMLDRNNDHMSIYLADDPVTGGYILTDLGEIIDDLDASGCDVLGSTARAKKLEQTLCGYGLRRKDSEIYAMADDDNLFQRMNMLMQGMASVDDLFYTAKDSVRQIFLEEVADWLDAHEIRATRNAIFTGRSGLDVKFDFVIPKTVGKAPERLIKAIGNPDKNSVTNALFGWDDISAVRGDSESYLFMNSAGGEVKPSLIQACENYDIHPATWPIEDSRIIEKLAA